jgi:hypothetical protein
MEAVEVSEKMERRRFWQEHVERQQASGLTQKEYCQEQGLRLHCFWYWKGRIHPRKTTVQLVEARVGDPHALLHSGSPLSLTMNGLYRIEIEKGFDPLTLKQLLHILREL